MLKIRISGIFVSGMMALGVLQAAPPQDAITAPEQDSKEVSFQATNANTRWAVQGEFSGTVKVEGGALKVIVTKCSLLRPPTFVQPVEVISLRAGVSRFSSTAFVMPRQGERREIRKKLEPSVAVDLGSFEFSIPMDHFQIRQVDRLSFAITVRNADSNGTVAVVYVHSVLELPGATVSDSKPASSIYFQAVHDPSEGGLALELNGRIHSEPDGLQIVVDRWKAQCFDEGGDEPVRIMSVSAAIIRANPEHFAMRERSGENRFVGRGIPVGSAVSLDPVHVKIVFGNYLWRRGDYLSFHVVISRQNGTREKVINIPINVDLAELIPDRQ